MPWPPSRPLPGCPIRKKFIGTQKPNTKFVAARASFIQAYQAFSQRPPKNLVTKPLVLVYFLEPMGSTRAGRRGWVNQNANCDEAKLQRAKKSCSSENKVRMGSRMRKHSGLWCFCRLRQSPHGSRTTLKISIWRSWRAAPTSVQMPSPGN